MKLKYLRFQRRPFASGARCSRATARHELGEYALEVLELNARDLGEIVLDLGAVRWTVSAVPA